MIQNKKKFVFLSSLLVSFGILGAVVFTQKSPQVNPSPADTITVQAAADVVPKAEPPTVNKEEEAEVKNNEAAKATEAVAKTAIVQYLSSQQEGIIGSFDGKQLDNMKIRTRVDKLLKY